jgi:hypothetical protein
MKTSSSLVEATLIAPLFTPANLNSQKTEISCPILLTTAVGHYPSLTTRHAKLWILLLRGCYNFRGRACCIRAADERMGDVNYF